MLQVGVSPGLYVCLPLLLIHSCVQWSGYQLICLTLWFQIWCGWNRRRYSSPTPFSGENQGTTVKHAKIRGFYSVFNDWFSSLDVEVSLLLPYQWFTFSTIVIVALSHITLHVLYENLAGTLTITLQLTKAILLTNLYFQGERALQFFLLPAKKTRPWWGPWFCSPGHRYPGQYTGLKTTTVQDTAADGEYLSSCIWHF